MQSWDLRSWPSSNEPRMQCSPTPTSVLGFEAHDAGTSYVAFPTASFISRSSARPASSPSRTSEGDPAIGPAGSRRVTTSFDVQTGPIAGPRNQSNQWLAFGQAVLVCGCRGECRRGVGFSVNLGLAVPKLGRHPFAWGPQSVPTLIAVAGAARPPPVFDPGGRGAVPVTSLPSTTRSAPPRQSASQPAMGNRGACSCPRSQLRCVPCSPATETVTT